MKPDQCLVVGCGYLGARVAKAWVADGCRVFVTTRSASRAAMFEREGFEPILLNIADPIAPDVLPEVQRVLFAVGFDRSDVHSQEQVYVRGLRNVLDALPNSPNPFIYVSSTGVYGQADDSWVDEQSPTEPTRDGGRFCLEAEELLRRHPIGRHSVTLRLAGIYGPDRVPFLQKLRKAEPLPVATEGYLNLIHVEDAVQVVMACSIEAESPQLFVVSDGTPVIRRAYYDEVARILGVSAIYDPPNATSPRTRRAMGSKRVKNDRMRKKLGIDLKYPNYERGLAAILATEG